MALKLYENVAIGNFLYGLGYAIASRVKEPAFPSVVNLLQQTPADTPIGDLLMRFPGVMRIIEFKQKANKDDKEPTRHKRLLTQLQHDARRRDISRRVHWFIETAPTETHFISRIVPYLDAYPPDNQQHDFASFIAKTADIAVRGEPDISDDELNGYLEFLATCHKSGTASAGGLVVKMSADGNLAYVALQSVAELRLEHYRVIESRLKKEAEFEKSQELALEKARELERQKTLDMSRNKELGGGGIDWEP